MLRMDHVVVVVEDLPAAVAFFTALGLEREGEASVEGPWADAVNGLDGVQVDLVMMRTPDGSGKLEVSQYRAPQVIDPGPEPANVLGLRSVMFEVDDLAATLTTLAAHGGTLVGEVADYEAFYRLCYVRGPGGAIVSLAQKL